MACIDGLWLGEVAHARRPPPVVGDLALAPPPLSAVCRITTVLPDDAPAGLAAAVCGLAEPRGEECGPQAGAKGRNAGFRPQ